MKFLVLAACMCVAAAAPQRYNSPFNAAAQASVVAAQPVVKAAVTAAKVAASPFAAGADATAEVLRSNTDVRADGYSYDAETSNGIQLQAVGELKTVGDQEVLITRGSYSYPGEDGKPVSVQYTADENGYQPSSDILPVPPAIPEQIARSLAYIAAHPPPVEKKF